MTVDVEKQYANAMSDKADAFTATWERNTAAIDKNISVVLTRPFIQLNFVSDCDLNVLHKFSGGQTQPAFIGYQNKAKDIDKLMIPNVWHFDSNSVSSITNPLQAQAYVSNAFKPYATFPVKTCTIEERAMKYHGVQYLLAPNDSDFSRLDITGNWIAFLNGNSGTVACRVIEGISNAAANSRYFIYPKNPADPNNPDPWTGPGVEFTITVNPVFDTTVETPIDNVADWP